MIKIVGGGVIGLSLGQLALWYLPGDWNRRQRDPFGAFETQVVLGGQTVTLSLQAHSMRSPEHFEVLAQTPDGAFVEVAPAPARTWRGVLVDVPGSRVAASLGPDGLSAMIALPDGLPGWGIQPASDATVCPSTVPTVVITNSSGR